MKKQAAGVALADQIEQEVRTGKYKPGAVLGFEPDLIARYEAGRSVVRQAVLILEQRGIAYSRRGKGGGLVLAEPDPASAMRALSMVIGSQLADFTDIAALTSAADNHQFLNCAAHIELAACDELDALMQKVEAMSDDEFVSAHGHGQIVNAFSNAFGDPAATLAQRTGIDYGTDLVPYAIFATESRRRGEFWELTKQLVAALISGNVSQLFDLRMQQWRMSAKQLTPFGDLEHADKRIPEKIETKPSASEPQSSAERLSREILRDIRQLHWKAGERIGGTDELLTRYGASPNVLRQAVCILEEYSAVEMQRGRTGGLLIAIPDEAVAIQRAVAYLELVDVKPENIGKFIIQLALEAINQSATKLDRKRLPELRAAIDRAKTPQPDQQQLRRDIYLAVTRLSGSPTLQLFVQLLLEYLSAHKSKPPAPSTPGVLDELFDAILTGHTGKARRAFIQFSQADCR
ncbi:MAG: GntR family transcriptional regulator [Verrucomicrobiaceae bacterium]|nr:GntR family transcriptional regulator [Verrucomicrobiaceae bacterium]